LIVLCRHVIFKMVLDSRNDLQLFCDPFVLDAEMSFELTSSSSLSVARGTADVSPAFRFVAAIV